MRKFQTLTDSLKLQANRVIRHIANSAATLYLPESHFDMVRVGLAMYGHSCREGQLAPIKLSPALSLRARIAQVKDVHAGAAVGYGGTWTATKDTRLAILPVGYADGVPRSISNRGHAIVRGARCPLVGRISMDQIVVDTGHIPVEPGEEIVLLGGQGDATASVESWAELDETVNYEILCGLGQRLPKVYYR